MKIGVVKRIFSRGYNEEQNEIIRFYGKNTVDNIKLLKHQIIIQTIRMASNKEIIVMKLDILMRGGRKKDFCDLHFF